MILKGSVMPALELKIPPPVVALLNGVLMWLAVASTPWLDFVIPGRGLLALLAVLTGFLVSSLGFFLFRKVGTTVHPTKPSEATSLVIAGIYNLTRNPMYMGLLLVLLGWAIFLSNVVAFIFLPVFILYINRFQIVPEERALEEKFGSMYVAYKERVRRWL
jgi:protein-S-isoprenylcysteine O-methyltransferase Ste14